MLAPPAHLAAMYSICLPEIRRLCLKSVHRGVCMYLCLQKSLSLSLALALSLSLSLSLFIYIYIYRERERYTCLYTNIYVCVYIYICVHTRTHTYALCTCASVFVRVCESVCVCVCVCLWLQARRNTISGGRKPKQIPCESLVPYNAAPIKAYGNTEPFSFKTQELSTHCTIPVFQELKLLSYYAFRQLYYAGSSLN